MYLQIENLSTIQNCSHPIIGTLLMRSCFQCSADFKTGINFVGGDVFDEGWLLSYTLSKGRLSEITEGKFYIDNNLIEYDKLKKLTYYVGYDELKLYKKVSMNHMLRMCKHWNDLKVKIYSFFLDNIDGECKIMNRKFEQMGHWIYFCSCLVGIAKGKKIFCFPWIDAKETLIQSYRFNLLAKYAQENDIIIIIPTSPLDEQAKHQIEYSYNYVIG